MERETEIRAEREPSAGSDTRKVGAKDKPSSASADPRAKPGLTYLEKREWETIEERILAAEQETERRRTDLDDPTVASDHEKLHAAYEAHQAASRELETLFARWQELERKLLG